MSSAQQLFDAAGRRRTPATMPDFHAGKAPGNKGQRYAADPLTVDEIIAVMRHASRVAHCGCVAVPGSSPTGGGGALRVGPGDWGRG